MSFRRKGKEIKRKEKKILPGLKEKILLSSIDRSQIRSCTQGPHGLEER